MLTHGVGESNGAPIESAAWPRTWRARSTGPLRPL